MKYLQAANALLRSGPGTCNALTRSATVLSSRIPSPPTATTQLTPTCPSGSHAYSSNRAFSQTTGLYKKRNKDDEVEEKGGRKVAKKGDKQTAAAAAASSTSSTTPDSSSSSASKGPQPNPEEPYDLADLAYTFDKAEAHHGEELKKLRTGGRFSADMIGAIPVHPDKKRNPTQAYPLREIATVAPVGGRRWSILAFEEASIKPIMSAVQASPEFNQQPQHSEDNPLELTISVEPERADALAKRVKDTCLAWRGKIRDVSHKREAVHKKWLKDGLILGDDLRKLKEKVQKMQDERMKVVQQREKEALQVISKR